jgi:hypothetical protein
VHDNRRGFTEDGWDFVSNFKPLALPPTLKEVQSIRAMRFAYEVVKQRSAEEYLSMVQAEELKKDIPEFVMTRVNWKEPAHSNTEKIPFQPEY